jgi:hypothetical protein
VLRDPRWRRSSLAACSRKRRYNNWSEAQRAIRRSGYDGWDHMEPYRCRACAGVHVGHPPEGE